MSNRIAVAMLMASGLGVIALGRFLPGRFSHDLPQVAGEDVLHLVLGDARQQLSTFMLGKAEDYFHGGVQHIACDHGLADVGTEVQHRDRQDDQALDTAATGHDSVGDPHPALPGAGGHRFDLWHWVNQRIHAQEHRHLEEEQLVELLPWVWVACRAAPQNIQAFQIGSYVLDRMTGHPEQGIRLLKEGLVQNPESPELTFALGEMWLNAMHDTQKAEKWFATTLRMCHPADGPEGAEARVLKVRALFYLGYLAKQRGDMERVRACLSEAETVSPGHVCVRDLRRMLGK